MNIAWLLFWQDNGLSLQRLGILAIKSEVVQQNARPLFLPFIVLALSLRVNTGTFDVANLDNNSEIFTPAE